MVKSFVSSSFVKAAIIIASVAALGGGGYAAYHAMHGDGLSAADQQMLDDLERLDEAKQNGEIVGSDIDITVNSEGGLDPEAIEEARERWKQQLAALMARDECGLGLDDFKEALELMINANIIDDEEMGDDIMAWVQANFAQAASRASTSWHYGTWADRASRGEVDIGSAGAGEGGAKQRVKESESVSYDKATWAEMASSLGLMDLYDAIIHDDLQLPSDEENQKCAVGYHAEIHGSGSETAVPKQFGAWEVDFNIHTCDEDPMNARWSGTFYWKLACVDKECAVGTVLQNTPISFTTQDGYAKLTLGSLSADVSIRSTQMFINYDFSGLELIGDIQSAVRRGSDECVQDQKESAGDSSNSPSNNSGGMPSMSGDDLDSLEKGFY